MKIRSPEALLTLVKNQRKRLGIEAALLASSANVSTKFISQVENGKQTVEVDSLLKLTHALGVRIPLLENAKELGDHIVQQRKDLGLDQVTTASLCNVSPRFLSTLENAKPGKRLNKLFDVLNGLGIEIEISL